MTKSRGKKAARLRLAVVGGGRDCLNLMRLLESRRLKRVQGEIVGVADPDPEAVGLAFARERSIFTTTDWPELLKIEDLDMIIELTGSEDLAAKLAALKPEGVQLLDFSASRLFIDLINFSQKLDEKEEEAQIAGAFAQTLMNATTEGVLVLDKDYRIVRANDAALRAAGLSQEEATGRYCFQVSHQSIAPCDSPETPCPMKQTLESGLSAHAIHEHVERESKAIYCDVSTYPLFNRRGEVVQVLEICRDITADMSHRMDRRTELIKADLARLVQEDKMKALGKLVASVAHEINNPIASIINFTKLILTSIRQSRPTKRELADFERYLDMTVREAERCSKIVGNLLSFARTKSIEPKRIDLRELMDRIIFLTKHKMELTNIELVYDIPPVGLEIWGDATQMQQCLTNLILNALEAMPQGGRLTLRGGLDSISGQVWLEVSDTGSGISPEHLPHIFEPFFSTKPEAEGLGLGLSMVYGIVRAHQGRIEASSEPGQGATFRLALPAAPGRNEEGGERG